MKVTAERIPESKVLLRIEIPPEQVQQAIDRTYRDLARRVRIPGFRPGKAPRNIVERYVGGAETVQQEGIDRLIDESYRQAIVETDTHPIADPDIHDHPEFKPGEPLVIEASVPVAPTVNLGDYDSIHMPPIAVEATPEQVNRFIDTLQEQNAEWVPVERSVKSGDQVVFDVLGVARTVPTLYGPGGEALLQTAGGTEVYDEKNHEHVVDIEAPSEFAPGFDEELVGMTTGAEKRFGLTLPADYSDQSLANQSIVFTVNLHEVKERHLPPIDDEFAKKVGAGETVEQMRETVRGMIQNRLEQETRQAYEQSLLDTLIERSEIDVPEVLVQRQLDAEIEDLKADLTRQRVSWSEYLQAVSRSDDAIRADLHEGALRRLRAYLVLREVARREGIQVLPEEIDADIEATAAPFGRAATIVRERLNTREQREGIETQILHRKAMRHLSQHAQRPRTDESSTEATVATESAEAPASGEGFSLAEATPTATATSPAEASTTAEAESAAREGASAVELPAEVAPTPSAAGASEAGRAPSTEESTPDE